MTVSRGIFFVLAAALFYAGCASAPQATSSGSLSAEELRESLDRSGVAFKNFSAEGTITVNSPSMNQSAGFDLVTRSGDSVKMSVYGPFGITVGSALFTRNEFTAYNSLNNTVYRGNPERQMKMLPFIKDVPFELLISALQGNHPLLPSAVIDSFTVTPEGQYRFTASVNDTIFDKYSVDRQFLRISQCTRKSTDGKTLWKVVYAYTQNKEGGIDPVQVTISIPSKESSLSLEYEYISREAPSSPMSISYPDDAEIITIE
jgi:outer membrane lipoprotein-sorting protein